MKKEIKTFLKKLVIVVSLVLFIIFAFIIINQKPTFADSGFSTSHSGGGYSGSYSSSHSSGSYGDSYSGGEITPIGVLVFIIYMIIFAIICKLIQKHDEKKLLKKQLVPTIDDTKIENKVKQYIPNFNKTEFLKNCYKMYCDIQYAWMDFKLEDVRDFLTDELYSMYDSQLATLEAKGEKNVMSCFYLKNSFLKDVVKENDTITITTGYIIEFYDYITEKASGKVIRGEYNHKMRVEYEMKFRQSLNENNKIEYCPNCGAPVKINNSGICHYCKAKLVTENTKWVLTEKKVLNQHYV